MSVLVRLVSESDDPTGLPRLDRRSGARDGSGRGGGGGGRGCVSGIGARPSRLSCSAFVIARWPFFRRFKLRFARHFLSRAL